MSLVLHNARLADADGIRPGFFDLRIDNGRIVRLLASGSGEADADGTGDSIDLGGATVVPGLVDPHCHLREPGQEYKEDIATGTRSAAAGGFTTVACMPNTDPVCDRAAIVRAIRLRAEEVGVVRVLPIGAVSKGLKGVELSEMGLMAEAGAVGVSDDGSPVFDADLMRKAVQYAAEFGLRVISHCEELSLSAEGHMNEGALAVRMGLRGIPSLAEEIMVARDLLIAEDLDLPIHLAHLSSARSVRMVREAKRRGVPVTAETCPHYFALTEEACRGYNTNAKMNPPLRTERDVEAIVEGLADGTLDWIATDHAPHHADEKDTDFALAKNGIIGFETAFPLAYTFLVRTGRMTLPLLLDRMSRKPAAFLGVPGGSLEPGNPADLAVLDLDTPFRVDPGLLRSKARNTPFGGWTLHGKPLMTLAGGRIVHDALR